MAPMLLAHWWATFRSFLVTALGNYGHFSGFWADSGHAPSAFMENQPVEIVGQIAKGQVGFGAG